MRFGLHLEGCPYQECAGPLHLVLAHAELQSGAGPGIVLLPHDEQDSRCFLDRLPEPEPGSGGDPASLGRSNIRQIQYNQAETACMYDPICSLKGMFRIAGTLHP